jgi:GT2 family glycosyltransferase
VTVIVAVVSFNTREPLLRCVTSLAPEVQSGRAEVWVVDNGSSDGSADAVRAAAPWARVLEPGSNLGFGRAVNAVAERTAGDWLLAANADVALEPGALQAMLAAGELPGVGCVAPRLLLPDGSTQHSVHPFPTVPLALAFNLGLFGLAPRTAERMCLEGFWDPERSRTVPWAIGACLLLRRAAFEDAGRFDERQWMYAEDVDLCWRLRDRGWLTHYEPAARVAHESGAATRAAFGDRQVDRFMVETYAMLLRRRGPARTIAIAALNIAGAAARVAWMTPLALLAARWREPAKESRRWLAAHLHAARRCSTLAHPQR